LGDALLLLTGIIVHSQGGGNLARSNYTFKKRQKELVRMKKQAEKRKRKLEKSNTTDVEITDLSQDEGESL
jgi:hypothetical protein